MSDLVDFIDRDAGLGQTESDCVDGKIAGVLLAAEALLLRGNHQLPVHHKSRRRIHSLCNSILAFLQAGPHGLLERHGIFQPADSNNVHNRHLRSKSKIYPRLVRPRVCSVSC